MEKYFVMYKRDVKWEKEHQDDDSRGVGYKNRLLFDRMKTFGDENTAKEYAINNMPSLYGVRDFNLDKYNLRDSKNPYVAVGQYHGKHSSSCMGETDYMTTYDVIRCSHGNVESTIEKLAGEKSSDKVFAGLELKLI
ncbi:hypothetical protein ACFL1H_03435 [Nanoarchaeota archaeon]